MAESSVESLAQAIAQALRRRTQRELVHLRCARCGEEAWAATASLAVGFGWTKLKRIKASEYHGLCMSCREHPGSP